MLTLILSAASVARLELEIAPGVAELKMAFALATFVRLQKSYSRRAQDKKDCDSKLPP